MMKNITKNAAPFMLWACALVLRKLINLNGIIAPHFVIVTPLLGSFVSPSSALSILGVLGMLSLFFKGLPITLGFPTFCATLSWSISSSKKTFSNTLFDILMHVLVPFVCIVLFLTHPVGTNACLYASYWIIPMITWTLRHTVGCSSSFIFSLQSTFVAHALGSVIWIFMMPTTPDYWLALTPLVMVERLSIAGTSALLYELGHRILATFSQPKKLFITKKLDPGC